MIYQAKEKSTKNILVFRDMVRLIIGLLLKGDGGLPSLFDS